MVIGDWKLVITIYQLPFTNRRRRPVTNYQLLFISYHLPEKESADSVPVRYAETFPFAKVVHLDLESPTLKAKTVTIQRATRLIVAVVEAAVKSEGTIVVACYLVTAEKMWRICLPWHLFLS